MSETSRMFAIEAALEVTQLQSKQPTNESFLALAQQIDAFITEGRVEAQIPEPKLRAVN